MGRLCRHSRTVHLDEYDLWGVLNVMGGRIGGTAEPSEIDVRSALIGAYHALDILRAHELRDQQEFFEVFDACAPWAQGWAWLDGEPPWTGGNQG